MGGILPFNPVEQLSVQTQGVGRWGTTEKTKVAPKPYTHNPTKRPYLLPAFDANFKLWCMKFLQDNVALTRQFGPVTVAHAIGEYGGLAERTKTVRLSDIKNSVRPLGARNTEWCRFRTDLE